jgi:hypothetical protein
MKRFLMKGAECVGQIALSLYAAEDIVGVTNRRDAPRIENINLGLMPKSALGTNQFLIIQCENAKDQALSLLLRL